MQFAKMQGVGNDFVVVALEDTPTYHLPNLARTLCARHTSIGADGLLVIGKSSSDAAFTFRMFNPDGSEDMCGNGLRCAALWAFHRNLVSHGHFNVDTKDGKRDCFLVSVDDLTAVVRVNMGEAKFSSHELPVIGDRADYVHYPISVLDQSLYATIVNTGSTHSVVFIDGPVDDVTFFKYSPPFENDPMFPERTSVIWTWQTGEDRFSIRIWERGAGETLGCGTGACAAAVAAVVNKKAKHGDQVVISSKGGDLIIAWTDIIWMTGPAVLVYTGTIE
jgi:diaminopimelate epimerase